VGRGRLGWGSFCGAVAGPVARGGRLAGGRWAGGGGSGAVVRVGGKGPGGGAHVLEYIELNIFFHFKGRDLDLKGRNEGKRKKAAPQLLKFFKKGAVLYPIGGPNTTGKKNPLKPSPSGLSVEEDTMGGGKGRTSMSGFKTGQTFCST